MALTYSLSPAKYKALIQHITDSEKAAQVALEQTRLISDILSSKSGRKDFSIEPESKSSGLSKATINETSESAANPAIWEKDYKSWDMFLAHTAIPNKPIPSVFGLVQGSVYREDDCECYTAHLDTEPLPEILDINCLCYVIGEEFSKWCWITLTVTRFPRELWRMDVIHSLRNRALMSKRSLCILADPSNLELKDFFGAIPFEMFFFRPLGLNMVNHPMICPDCGTQFVAGEVCQKNSNVVCDCGPPKLKRFKIKYLPKL